MKINRLHLTLFFTLIFVAVSCEKDKKIWSYNGNDIDSEGLYDFYLYDVTKNENTRITSSPDILESSYSISPDSKKILYTNDYGINIMNIDGSDNKLIFEGFNLEGYGYSPCFSPDGKKIIFEDNYKLFSINIDGSNKSQIVNTDRKLWHPLIAKDGQKIACSSESGICIVTFDGQIDDILFAGGNRTDMYEWSSDSKELFYSIIGSNNFAQIFKYNIIQKKKYQITNNDKYNYSPKYNPYKNVILFTSGQQNYGTDLIICDEDGENQNVVINKDNISSPYWSPNGDKIVFITDEANLAIVNIDGSNYKIINEIPGACVEPPIWSNDGNYILYYRAIYYM